MTAVPGKYHAGEKKYFLGIDAGSATLSLVVTDDSGKAIYTSYNYHRGQIEDCLKQAMTGITDIYLHGIGFTSSVPPVLKRGTRTDTRIAFISAAKLLHPGLEALLIVGAEKFGLVSFDKNGDYRNYRSNTSCAAGTGSFLDQQAERLGLSGIREFSDIACRNTGAFPKIASRCAVFAKTDLIHAQQEGFSVEEICDGLSYGLARNIVDAVFCNLPVREVIVSGGVAQNKAVLRHIDSLTGLRITADAYAHLYGALGAALNCMASCQSPFKLNHNYDDFLENIKREKKLYYPSLSLKLSVYPDFSDHQQYEFVSACFPRMKPVEVDLYTLPSPGNQAEVYLGIDIGSTSTKAVLLGTSKEVYAGFYTRTAGQPLNAVQEIFEAVRDLEVKHGINFIVRSSATTGSGRNFIGKIIGADAMPDEITAHARAACELDPLTDTIIEIGGQDSKFTILHNGAVTFSVMNNVCAAGTGSFIEEQAKKLDFPLGFYSERAEKVGSPLSSDRCTVFMERDLNHFLNEGYSKDELLASVLHSIRDNYLTKVVGKRKIGNRIFFQGATARNKALVAAFEQKLGKPIMVSKYCHLTGALGVALELYDREIQTANFRGIDIYRDTIPVRSETCEICTNHCKLKIAEIGNETEAYGFLCGRDYTINKYIKNKTTEFELVKRRKELYRYVPETNESQYTIGIPSGLHLFEDMLFWQKFFDLLSIKTITSENCTTAVKDGKNLCGAEFCAPIAALHGHVNYLIDKTDFIYLPVYLEENDEGRHDRQYCYYTQFVSPVISVQDQFESHPKILTPLIKSSYGELYRQMELTEMFKSAGMQGIGLLKVSQAFEAAKNYCGIVQKEWTSIYTSGAQRKGELHVMLLGRPYTVLSPIMNNHIPEIFEKKGVQVFYMDMIPGIDEPMPKIDELLKVIRWNYAARILKATGTAVNTPGCYPVLVTSFKCTPDSFVIEYFKEILEYYGKPYLILQLDEHDSSVGYETRIEAAIHSFRNHLMSAGIKAEGEVQTKLSDSKDLKSGHSLIRDWEAMVRSLVEEASGVLKLHRVDQKKFKNPFRKVQPTDEEISTALIRNSSDLKGKTLLLPCWDEPVGCLLEAVLRNAGYDARLLPNSDEAIQFSLRYNTGQCLPLNIIVQNAIDYISENNLNPADTVLWNAKTQLSCNLSMFPHYMSKLLKEYGHGMEKVAVYIGTIIFNDISLQTGINAYLAYMFGGNIRKIACKIRPYEKEKGLTDHITNEAYNIAREAFMTGSSKEAALNRIISLFESIAVNPEARPKVAIFGDLFVRDNDLMNQDLVRFIEKNGGEVITTPYTDYIKILVNPITHRSLVEGNYFSYMKETFLKSLIPLVEEKYNGYFNRILNEPVIPGKDNYEEILDQYGIKLVHRGESFENILKIHHLIEVYPDLTLFVQTNPSYCCPSLVTEAMTSRIEKVTGIPVVTIEYDGTAGFKNDDIIPYLRYRKPKVSG